VFGLDRKWWTPEDLTKFQAKTACVTKQFDCYRIDGPDEIHIEHKLVLGESIGELAGLKIAYRAFQEDSARAIEREGRRFQAGSAVPDRVGSVSRGCHERGDAKANGAG
jgi:predicted metalloendopeptidase